MCLGWAWGGTGWPEAELKPWSEAKEEKGGLSDLRHFLPTASASTNSPFPAAEISALAGHMLLQDPRQDLSPDLCAWKQSCILHQAIPQDSVPASQAGLSPSHLSTHRSFRIMCLSTSSACELRGSLVPSVI